MLFLSLITWWWYPLALAVALCWWMAKYGFLRLALLVRGRPRVAHGSAIARLAAPPVAPQAAHQEYVQRPSAADLVHAATPPSGECGRPDPSRAPHPDIDAPAPDPGHAPNYAVGDDELSSAPSRTTGDQPVATDDVLPCRTPAARVADRAPHPPAVEWLFGTEIPEPRRPDHEPAGQWS